MVWKQQAGERWSEMKWVGQMEWVPGLWPGEDFVLSLSKAGAARGNGKTVGI